MKQDEGDDLVSLLRQYPARVDRRDWARGRAAGSVSREEAVALVRSVFDEQIAPMPSGREVGADLMIGMCALGDYFSTIPPENEEIRRAIDLAVEDYYAFQALVFLYQLTKNYSPKDLAAWQQSVYLGIASAPPKPKGQSKLKNAHRDMLIKSQLRQLDAVGFSPTRNPESKSQHRNSGCDVVAEALCSVGILVSYAAVESVWKSNGITPSPLAELLAEGLSKLRPLRR